MTQSDRDLIGQIRDRDANAFETLFVRYREMVRRHLASIVRDEDAADDLVQEVFLRVWTRAEQWNGRGAFKAWLFRIATNLALNHLRSLRRRRQQSLEISADPADDDDESPVPGWMIDASSLGPDAVLEQAEQHDLLQGLIDRFPEEKRAVFRMVHEMEMDIRDVAHALDIPGGTVKSRLHYARKHLARKWKEIAIEWEDT